MQKKKKKKKKIFTKLAKFQNANGVLEVQMISRLNENDHSSQ